jgi:hypothetical protein
MKHLSIREILAYLADRVEGDDVYRIEGHLAECLKCAARVDRFMEMRDRFDEVWDGIGKPAGVEAAYLEHVRRSLAGASLNPEEESRVSQWMGDFFHKTGGMVGLAIDATRKAASVLEERLGELVLPQGGYQFTPAKQPVLMLGPGEPAPVVLEAAAPGFIRKIHVDPAAGRISIQANVMKRPWPLVLLVPREGGRAEVAGFRQPAAVDYLLAEFEDVPGGEYELLFEAPSA